MLSIDDFIKISIPEENVRLLHTDNVEKELQDV